MHRLHRNVWTAGFATIVALASVGALLAQERTPAAKPAAKEVTLTGTIVDLHCYMTDDYSGDKAKCAADCIKAGVPAALATADGLVLLGQGYAGAAKVCAPLAMQAVEVHGRLIEKNGVKYLDVISVKRPGAAPAAAAPRATPPSEPATPPTPVRPAPPAGGGD
jgi:hypothetical protein